jgi:hypothetical protein
MGRLTFDFYENIIDNRFCVSVLNTSDKSVPAANGTTISFKLFVTNNNSSNNIQQECKILILQTKL